MIADLEKHKCSGDDVNGSVATRRCVARVLRIVASRADHDTMTPTGGRKHENRAFIVVTFQSKHEIIGKMHL